jgi:hypothetical protein
MPRLSFLLAPTALALLAAPLAQAGPRPPEPLKLVWLDVVGVAAFAYEGASEEAARVLADHGLAVAWARGGRDTVRADDEIGVVILPRSASARGRNVMGATVRTAGAATVWAHVEETADAVALPRRPATWSGGERRRFAQALGRVIAHEVVHALLPGRPHDEGGLMAARLDRKALSAGSVRVDPRLAHALRTTVRTPPVSSAMAANR